MKVIFSKFLLFSLVLSFCQSGNLLDDYKRKIGSGDVTVSSAVKTTVPTYSMADEINILNAFKKKTFESSKEFSARVNTEILSRGNDIVFYIKSASKNYSVGTIKMKRYNPDSEIMTLNLTWDKQIKELLPQSGDFRTVAFNIPREEAKKIFEKSQKHYFHIKLKDMNNKLIISKILFTDKYLLYTDINTQLSMLKSDHVKKPTEKFIQKQEVIKCKEYYVTADRLNVRNRASKRSQVVDSVNKNDTVCVYEFYREWAKVENGWISQKYIQPSKTTVSEPIPEQKARKTSSNTSKNNSKDDSSGSWWWWLLLLLFFAWRK